MKPKGSRLETALLTARGEAGIAIFRLRGEDAAPVLDRIFAPRTKGPLLPGQIRVGAIMADGVVLDDAIVKVGPGPALEAEISIHGSVFVAERLEALLKDAGARPLPDHGAWSLGRTRGLPAGDRIVAEARQALLTSFSDLQTSFFLSAIEGRLSHETRSLERSIRALPAARDAGPLAQRLGVLLRRAAFGAAMADPAAVVLAGLPNAGKSTLFNALLGEQRTIVSPEPGTTRDVIVEPFTIAGFPFRLADSAGLRGAADAVERIGVARAESAAAAADIVVLLIDPEADWEAQAGMASARWKRCVVAVSKSDLPAASRRPVPDALRRPEGPVFVSAREGRGLEELRARILDASAFGRTAELRQPSPFLPRHRDLLEGSRDALRDPPRREDAARALRRLHDA